MHGRAAGAVTRESLPATGDNPQWVDCEDKRAGTTAAFMFCEPLSGRGLARARKRRTKTDWAHEVAGLLEERYAGCEKVTLVPDNLYTHTKGAFYAAFEPERARELARRIEFCHTPNHGSWLNVAACELSAMTRQCLSGRRIGALSELRTQIAAWATAVNGRQHGVERRMRIDDARCKLKAVYPRIIL